MTTSPRASGPSPTQPTDHDLLIRALGQLDDLKEDVAGIRGWTEDHTQAHALSDKAFQTHLIEASRREVHDEEWGEIKTELKKLHDFQTTVLTIGRMVQWLVGTSAIAALAAMASLALTLAHIIHPGP